MPNEVMLGNKMSELVLGKVKPTYTVARDTWFAAYIDRGYALCGCTVSPPFTNEGFTLKTDISEIPEEY